ncbi:MAG: TonB family protein [Pseudomonadales bacterium]|nr:TonB family protein [Pseudomonadales bacterium]
MSNSVDNRSILFDGELLPGVNKAEVISRLQPLTGLSEDELIDELFSIKPIILKQAADPKLAQHFVTLFEEAGLKVTSLPPSKSLDLVLDIDLPFVYIDDKPTESNTETYLKIIADATVLIERTAQPTENCFRLIFEGECDETYGMDTVRENLQHLTGASDTEVHEELFSFKPLIIIESPEMAVINEYKYAYEQAGLKLRLEDPDANAPELFKTRLRIRQDSPAVIRHKNPYIKVLTTLLAVGVISGGWIHLQSQWVSRFTQHSADKTIAIRIAAKQEPVKSAPPAATQPDTSPKPLKPPKANKPTAVPPAKTAKPIEQQSAAAKPAQPKSSKKQKNSSYILQLEREQYSNQLRLWLAQQQNAAPAVIEQGMHGKVKLLIRINADGSITHTKVLSRSGPIELEQIALDDARNASPYPKIPVHFPEDTYTLEVSISYQPTTKNRANN